MEYFDLSTSIQKLVGVWSDHAEHFDQYIPYWSKSVEETKERELGVKSTHRAPLDPTLLSVRNGICVTGFNWLSLQRVKKTVAELLPPHEVALESLHVKKAADVKDGALLVPKVILVAQHCPGKKLIDDDGNEGQLDYIYDEICDMGADVFVVYLDLPRSIYSPMKHMVYHPRLIDLVFPQQRILKQLAGDNLLVTLVQNQEDFTFMQKNVLREWLEKPVDGSHPVYKAADYLSSAEIETFGPFSGRKAPEVNFYSESEVLKSKKAQEKPKKKKKERKRLFGGRDRKGYQALPQSDLMDLGEDDQMEMEIYTRQDTSTQALPPFRL